MKSVRVLAAVAVLAAAASVYALYSAISIGFVWAVAGSGFQAMDELRFSPDYEKRRAELERVLAEDSRRMRRFKTMAAVSAVITFAAASAAIWMKVEERAKRRRV